MNQNIFAMPNPLTNYFQNYISKNCTNTEKAIGQSMLPNTTRTLSYEADGPMVAC